MPVLDSDALIKLLAPLLVAIVSNWARRRFEGRVKLMTYLVHSAANTFPANAPAQPAATAQGAPNAPAAVAPPALNFIHTHALLVKNVGKKTAHNVRIGHNFLPGIFNIFPPVTHEVIRNGNSGEIILPVLVPGEQVTVSYLYGPPLVVTEILGQVKADEGFATSGNVIPSVPPPPKWLAILLALLAFIGASTVLYWGLTLAKDHLFS